MTIQSVLVPVKGEDYEEQAVRFACILANSSRALVHLIHVITVPRSLPVDAEVESETLKGENILERFTDIIQGSKSRLETQLLQSRAAGPAVVQYAMENGLDTIVTSSSSNPRYLTRTMGSTVRYLLANAPCNVVVCKGPPQAKLGGSQLR